MVYWYKEEGQEKKEGGKTPKSKEPQKEKELRPKISFRPKTHFETDFREFEKKIQRERRINRKFSAKRGNGIIRNSLLYGTIRKS